MTRALALLSFAAVLAPSCGGGSGSGRIGDEELVRACIGSTACGVRAYPRAANCVEAYYTLHLRFGLGPVYDAIYRCVNAAAGDCEKIYACYGANRLAGSCDGSFVGRCDGSRAVSCDLLSHRVLSFDCSAAALTCQTKAEHSFEAFCTTSACSGDSVSCDGGRLLSCRGGVTEVEDCQAQGLVCAEGQLQCVGATEETCGVGKYPASCDGNTAVSCQGGRVSRKDCGAYSLAHACVDGACAPSGGDCLDDFDRCEGAALQTCIDGRWTTYDCAALGLSPCQPATNGAACGAPN
jgi:hypothetical protein